MPKYKYTSIDNMTNEVNHGKLEASSEDELEILLNRRNQSLLKSSNPGSVEFLDKLDWRMNRVSSKDRIVFTRQLSTLASAGLPITQSLRILLGQVESPALSKVLNDVVHRIEGGSSLGAALEEHPKVFSQVYINLVKAGESSGTLDNSLERLALQQEKDAAVLSKIKGALVYPAIVMLVVLGVVIFMLVVVLPVVADLYRDLGSDVKLPLATRLLVGASDIIIKWWFVIIVIVGALMFLVKSWSRSKTGRRTFDRIKLKMPLFGSLFTKMYMARFCRTEETLLASGVPVIESLNITGQAVNNVILEDRIDYAAQQVKGGKQLSDSIAVAPEFPDLVPDMIGIGEQSGDVDGLLGKAASYYERELDTAVKAISTTIEPLMMVIVAIVVAVLIAAILLPIYGLINGNISL